MNTPRLRHQLGKAGVEIPAKVVKRDGSLATFDASRIERALERCYEEIMAIPPLTFGELTTRVVSTIAAKFTSRPPTVEEVQDIVELTLLGERELTAARAYIAYRDARAAARSFEVPAEVREAFEADKQYLPTPMQQFQFYDKYSRFDWSLMRRETWIETVDRSVQYLKELSATAPNGQVISDATFERIHTAILNHEVMPSMRLLAMAGEPAWRNSISIYNCSYMPVADLRAFSEAILISMAGCGVGFSVERIYVDQLPPVKRQTGEVFFHQIGDSTEGWADAVLFGMETWFNGGDVRWDDSIIRPAGSILKTKGGRASGPEPLMTALNGMRDIILARQGGYIRPIDAMDMMDMCGEAAVQGGVRRTAMICLFDWDDHEVRNAKNGPIWNTHPWRQNSNNSAVWPANLEQTDVVRQMLEMAESGSGEPGIFSRENALKWKPARRNDAMFGTNPCGEILLRPYEFCNLSQAIGREHDTEDSLREKVRLATIVGTIQSLATNFPGLRDEWKQNCEEERLLGVDVNGQQDCPVFRDSDEVQRLMRQEVIDTNWLLAGEMGINPSAATTCGKPAGNSSLKVNSGSGAHRRKARYIKRRATVGAHGPIFRVLNDAGVPMEPKAGQTAETASQWIATFPIKAPDAALTEEGVSALEQLEYWKRVTTNWAEHNQSITITHTKDELLDVTKWVWDNRDMIGGVTFYQSDNTVYAQAPVEAITAEEYDELARDFPDIDFSLLWRYEKEDMTTAASELACMAGVCDTSL